MAGMELSRAALMVRTQVESRGVRDEAVLQAMREIDRALFVPPELRHLAWEDYPLQVGCGQTISQPYIVALMTELLELKPHHRVLEIGTGSGYQTALLSRLAAEVFTLEILRPLADQARALLTGLGCVNIHFRHGDGSLGWPEEAPFDRIIATAAPETVPPALTEQLAPLGRLVLPAGPQNGQRLKICSRKASGNLTIEDGIPVRFVPMTGAAAPDGQI